MVFCIEEKTQHWRKLLHRVWRHHTTKWLIALHSFCLLGGNSLQIFTRQNMLTGSCLVHLLTISWKQISRYLISPYYKSGNIFTFGMYRNEICWFADSCLSCRWQEIFSPNKSTTVEVILLILYNHSSNNLVNQVTSPKKLSCNYEL